MDLNSHPLPGAMLGNLLIFSKALLKEVIRHVVNVAALSKPFRDRCGQITGTFLNHGFLAFVHELCILHYGMPQSQFKVAEKL